MQTTDIAYAAGLLDGEGYVGLVYRKPRATQKQPQCRYTLQVCIGMTHEPTVRWLSDTFGLNFFRKEPREAHHSVSFLAYAQSTRAGDFLRLVQPYVRTKSEQVALAIDFIEHFHDWRSRTDIYRGAVPDDEHARRHNIYTQLRDLNGRRRGDQSHPNVTVPI